MNLDGLLARASNSTLATYHPGHLIDVVNALLPRGKDGALAELEAFLAKRDLANDPHQGLFLVLRVLFDADPYPPVRLGGSRPPPPPQPTVLPRFPIMIVDDVPLMLVVSYTLRGLPEPVTAHLDYYRSHGTLRSMPLTPMPGPNRLATYENRYKAAYQAAPSPAERAFVKSQLDRLNL